ncbi:MAG TPA: alpha/beta fold hydrolase [Acidimicrobiia bacterium]|jgi:pimeloyl-ACP methyl ester carboxylesterase|nr:alpha/beta fold hydrolase [Acidimicrobiia bacterium]
MPLTTINGCRHFYEDEGRGEPIVLLHGIMNSSLYFEGIIPDLALDFRVIAPHFRGMGRSEHVPAVPPGAWAGDVLALLDALGVNGFHLYGVSLGGIIAMRLAVDCPERVWTLTVDAPVITVAGLPNPTAPRAEIPREMAEQLAAMHGDDWVTVEENLNRSLHAPGMAEHLNLGDDVKEITSPTLVIRGDIDEPFHPLIQAVDLHAALPDSRLWIAPRTRSLMVRRRPTDSLRVVRDFVAEHSRLHGPGSGRAGDIELLKAVPLFAGLAPASRARLAACAESVESLAGDVVFRQGDLPDGLYVVKRGTFSVWVAGPNDPAPVHIRTLGAGDYFGEMSLLTNDARSATVRCETEGELLRIGGPHIGALLARDASAASAVAAALSHYVRTQNLTLADAPHGPTR